MDCVLKSTRPGAGLATSSLLCESVLKAVFAGDLKKSSCCLEPGVSSQPSAKLGKRANETFSISACFESSDQETLKELSDRYNRLRERRVISEEIIRPFITGYFKTL